jgi:hypothetical protein
MTWAMLTSLGVREQIYWFALDSEFREPL